MPRKKKSNNVNDVFTEVETEQHEISEDLKNEEISEEESKVLIEDSEKEISTAKSEEGTAEETVSAELSDSKEDPTSSNESIDKPVNTDSYLEEDEYFLKGDDEKVLEENDQALYKQLENVINWEVTGLYSDDGSLKSRSTLRNEPPIFTISSSSGDSVQFVITKDLSQSLAGVFTRVYKGYFGVDPTKNKPFSKENFKEKFISIKKWIWSHKIGTGLVLAVIAFVFIYPYFK